jgi:CRISPR/Cas system CMR-associated protein Cmr5 small subunit
MQSTEIADKSSQNAYKSYDYQLPSGKIIRLQGYEKFAVDFLLSKGHEETDIITARGEVPTIWYKDGNKNRRYFIDIFIPSKKLGIEVKSTYTYESNSNKVQLKQEAFKQAGYECEIWVMTRKGDLLTVY